MHYLAKFVVLFALSALALSAVAATTNTTLIGQGATLSDTSAGSTATYTLKAKIKNKNGANIAVGNLVTLTLPAGSDGSTVTSGTFDLDTAGSPAAITSFTMRTATTVQFTSPSAIAKNKTFRLVLNNVTNPPTPGAYRASVVTQNSSGGANTGNNIFSYTITAAAAKKLAFSVQPANTAANATLFPAVKVTVLDALNNPVTTATNSITISLNNPATPPVPAGVLSGTLTVSAINGVATFPNLSVDQVASGYTLTAMATNLSSATSNTFDIGAATARLEFGTQPATATAGSTLAAVTVVVKDAFGNINTSATNVITLGIGTNPGGGTLIGATSATAVNGVATFSNVSIQKSGLGYNLTATSGVLSAATSSSFDINPGAAVKLGFIVQPSTTAAGDATNSPNPIDPAVQVAVQDQYGNTVTSRTDNIAVTFGSNPGNGSITSSSPANVGNTVTVAAVASSRFRSRARISVHWCSAASRS